jgi:hypothetical protein
MRRESSGEQTMSQSSMRVSKNPVESKSGIYMSEEVFLNKLVDEELMATSS